MPGFCKQTAIGSLFLLILPLFHQAFGKILSCSTWKLKSNFFYIYKVFTGWSFTVGDMAGQLVSFVLLSHSKNRLESSHWVLERYQKMPYDPFKSTWDLLAFISCYCLECIVVEEWLALAWGNCVCHFSWQQNTVKMRKPRGTTSLALWKNHIVLEIPLSRWPCFGATFLLLLLLN